jgi:hypothetical protein
MSFTRDHHADWPEERIREAAAGFFTLHTMAKRDVKGFASMARLHLQTERCRIKVRKLELEKLKFEESLRRKLDAGLDALARVFKKKPEAMRLYQEARKLVEENGTIENEKP